MSNAKKILDRYQEIERLARDSFFPPVPKGQERNWRSSASYTESDLQDRIRTMAVIREVIESEDKKS